MNDQESNPETLSTEAKVISLVQSLALDTEIHQLSTDVGFEIAKQASSCTTPTDFDALEKRIARIQSKRASNRKTIEQWKKIIAVAQRYLVSRERLEKDFASFQDKVTFAETVAKGITPEAKIVLAIRTLTTEYTKYLAKVRTGSLDLGIIDQSRFDQIKIDKKLELERKIAADFGMSLEDAFKLANITLK